jgi:putative hydrolase of the HAD superfamily
MSVSAVIFDLDDTLVEDVRTADSSFEEVRRRLRGDPNDEPAQGDGSWQAMRDAVRAVWRSGRDYGLCVELGFSSWEGLWSTFEGNHPVLDGVKQWVPTFRREAWTAALATLGLHDHELIPTAEAVFVAAQDRGNPLLPGAAQTVRHFSAQHRLGILTNGPSDIQRQKLEGAGLTAEFECVAISGEMGVGKPAPAAFAEILGRLDVEPHDAVMVGDSWERDIEGAVAAGLPSVWIASGRPPPVAVPPQGVTVIETIEGLPDVLR